MAVSTFNHVRISGIKTVIPERFIDIDDEIQYFDNDFRKLARAKKMAGFGRRFIADKSTTVTDLAVHAAKQLLKETEIAKDRVDLLIFVNQQPDYVPTPNDACLAHGQLGLSRDCTTLDINLGCSGYVHGLLLAHALIASRNYENCLLLAGGLCARDTEQSNRKRAPIFGDAASATFLCLTEEERPAFFVTGTDGTGWNKIVCPVGGTRLPLDKDTIDLKVVDPSGEHLYLRDEIIRGEEIFSFTMHTAPKLIQQTLSVASWEVKDVDLFAIHQANKQIVDNIVSRAHIPAEKAPSDVFTKYANNSTTSVATVICDANKALSKVVLCSFGVGLSWGGAALDLTGMHNGGISIYVTPKNALTRNELIKYWMDYFSGVRK